MKEVCKVIVWEADDGTQFESKEECGIYENISKNPLEFLSTHYKFFDIYSPLEGAEKEPWYYCRYASVIKQIAKEEVNPIRAWCKKQGISGGLANPDLRTGDVLEGLSDDDFWVAKNYGWRLVRIKELEDDIKRTQKTLEEYTKKYEAIKLIQSIS